MEELHRVNAWFADVTGLDPQEGPHRWDHNPPIIRPWLPGARLTPTSSDPPGAADRPPPAAGGTNLLAVNTAP